MECKANVTLALHMGKKFLLSEHTRAYLKVKLMQKKSLRFY